VNGLAAIIASDPMGDVTLNGVYCMDPDQFDTINVVGGALNDKVTFSGRFEPGLNYESDFEEIEINVDLGAGSDTVSVKMTASFDTAYGDADDDYIEGDAGNDIIHQRGRRHRRRRAGRARHREPLRAVSCAGGTRALTRRGVSAWRRP